MNEFCYSIDALSSTGKQSWRLQQDERHWRPCRFAEALQSGDACITDKEKAADWAGRRLKRDKNLTLKPLERPGLFDFLARGIFAHVILHRFSPPPIPSEKELAKKVAELVPGIPWLIYLDRSGHFRALDTRTQSILHNIDIAVRGEIASSPGFVGPEAAQNQDMMHEWWVQFLAGWLEHLRSSRLGIFVPDPDKLKDPSSYIAAIESWEHETLCE